MRAASLNAVAQAERYFTEALDLTDGDDPERLQLLFKLGAVKHIQAWGGSEELAEARDGFIAAGDPEAAAYAALRIADIFWSRISPKISAARTKLPAATACPARSHGDCSGSSFHRGQYILAAPELPAHPREGVQLNDDPSELRHSPNSSSASSNIFAARSLAPITMKVNVEASSVFPAT